MCMCIRAMGLQFSWDGIMVISASKNCWEVFYFLDKFVMNSY